MPDAIKLFISFADHDEQLFSNLMTALSPLRQKGMITEFHNRQIRAGAEWEKESEQFLSQADIILLLVSADFNASSYIYGVVTSAMERHARGDSLVIPIILRDCNWETTQFAKLQPLPSGAKPVTSWSNPDQAWAEIARSVQTEVSRLADLRKLLQPPKERPSRSAVVQLDQANYAEFVGRSGVALVFFSADWVEASASLSSTVSDIAQEHAEVVRVGEVNFDTNQEFVRQLGIRDIPMFLLYSDGKCCHAVLGDAPLTSIVDAIVSKRA